MVDRRVREEIGTQLSGKKPDDVRMEAEVSRGGETSRLQEKGRTTIKMGRLN